MAQTKLGDTVVDLNGELPAVGSQAPSFELVRRDLKRAKLEDFKGKRVLSFFPSIDTGVCSASVRNFNAKAGTMEGVTVLNISRDLPFAHNRFCGAEGLDGVETLSMYLSPETMDAYGLRMLNGGFEGLAARSVVVIDEAGKVLYTELVPSIGQEPNYDAALAALG